MIILPLPVRLVAEFVSTFSIGKDKKIYIPTPTWPNHFTLTKNAGLTPITYRYFNAENCRVDFESLVEDVLAAEDGSLFLLHACAHNPTGCDPTRAQWDQLSSIFKQKQHIVFFDSAYQVTELSFLFFS